LYGVNRAEDIAKMGGWLQNRERSRFWPQRDPDWTLTARCRGREQIARLWLVLNLWSDANIR
jgi:hypothetical protein